MMPKEDVTEIRGMLIGYKDDLDEIKANIKDIENNDKDKLVRITKLETKNIEIKDKVKNLEKNKEMLRHDYEDYYAQL